MNADNRKKTCDSCGAKLNGREFHAEGCPIHARLVEARKLGFDRRADARTQVVAHPFTRPPSRLVQCPHCKRTWGYGRQEEHDPGCPRDEEIRAWWRAHKL
jgi:hypothetical protein